MHFQPPFDALDLMTAVLGETLRLCASAASALPVWAKVAVVLLILFRILWPRLLRDEPVGVRRRGRRRNSWR